jgi:hypothetical protein
MPEQYPYPYQPIPGAPPVNYTAAGWAYYAQSPPPTPTKPGRGLAITSLVLGIVGAAMGIVPLLCWMALVLGLLGLIFGLVGRRHGMGKAGIVLSLVSLTLGVVGAVILANAVHQVSKDLNSIGEVPSTSLPVPTLGDGDSGYLDNVHSVTQNTGQYTDDELVQFGHAVCGDFDGGNTWLQTVGDATTAGFTAYDSGAVISAAVMFYCPQYLIDLPN